jgi:hypothetical protein
MTKEDFIKQAPNHITHKLYGTGTLVIKINHVDEKVICYRHENFIETFILYGNSWQDLYLSLMRFLKLGDDIEKES